MTAMQATKIILLCVLLLSLSGYTHAKIKWPYGHLETITGLMFFRPGTRYAERFSESEFAKIRVGMTKEQVVELVGEPLLIKNHTGDEHYHYSQCNTGKGHHHMRILVLEENTVSQVYSAFWVD